MLQYFSALLQPQLNENKPVYVAFSGGLDSSVLLHLASKLNAPVSAIHVNHNLSSNAVDWQQHCQQVCEDLQVEFIAKSVKLKNDGSGLEAEARKLRYAAIKDVIKPNAVVLTGQHQDDQLETFLLQLKRGAGPKGLSSMPESAAFGEDSILLRPLLHFSRAELEHYANKNKLRWIEDESNSDTRFDRNFIRHQVTPILTERWQSFSKAATRSIGLIAEQQQLVEELAQADLIPLLVAQDQISISSLVLLSDARQRNVVRFWIDTLDILPPSKVILQRLFDEVIAAKPDANPKVQWAGHQIRRYRDCLYLLHDNIDKPGIACTLELNKAVILNDSIGTAELSNSHQDGGLKVPAPNFNEKVTVRFDVKGLKCKPQGDNHTRSLSDIYKQHNIPPWQRKRIPLLFYGEQLIAIGNICVSSGDRALAYCFCLSD